MHAQWIPEEDRKVPLMRDAARPQVPSDRSPPNRGVRSMWVADDVQTQGGRHVRLVMILIHTLIA